MSANGFTSLATLIASLFAASWPPPRSSVVSAPRPWKATSLILRPYIWKRALKYFTNPRAVRSIDSVESRESPPPTDASASCRLGSVVSRYAMMIRPC